MFYFSNTRIPDFSKIQRIDYNHYWQRRGFSLNKKLKEREQIILDLIIPAGAYLDLGCGNSLLPVKIKDKGCSVEVADLSTEVIKGYSLYDISGWVIDLENVEELTLPRHYNGIILSEVLEHTKNPEEIIKILSKYSDQFFISVPNSAFYRYRFHLMFSGRFFTQWVYHPGEHLRFWSHLDFLDWLKAMGLEVIKFSPSNGFSFFGLAPWLKDYWPNLFAHQVVYCCNVDKKNDE